MNIFKVPKKNQVTKSVLVGIIDASGSMEPCWEWLIKFWNQKIPKQNTITITFDNNVHPCNNNVLSDYILDHGGGGTNITQAFERFEQHLDNIPKDTAITVIFISDGDDMYPSTLSTRFAALKGHKEHMINFICLGVGSEFPTFLSMRLREKYHTGDATLPAIFLIEYPSEKAFLNKFESIQPYLEFNHKRNIEPPVLLLPWREYYNFVHENAWILTDSNKIKIDGEVYDISDQHLNLDGLVQCFRSWTQVINIESVNKDEDVKDKALKTLALMDELIQEVKAAKKIDLLNLEELKESEDISFGERAFINYIKHTVSRAAWYYEDVKLLAEGKSAKDLNEFDAAKRIGIGTIVGKYHQKAFALQGFTVDDFLKVKEAFKSTFLNTKLDPTSNQEASVVTLQNQKEIFLQKDFIKGLDHCMSQFDLVEAFPVVGLAIKIKRFDGSRLNPWLTEVRFIAKAHKAIDSIAILKAKNSLALKVGDKTENINAVLPLFDKCDADLRPLISSKLYHLLMTFNVMQNVDTLYEDAYLSLLSNTLVYLFAQPESEWRDELFRLIHTTTQITYYHDNGFNQYRKGLLNNPVETIDRDEAQSKFGGKQDLSKPILHLFCMVKDKEIDETKAREIMRIISTKYVYGMIKDKDFKIESCVTSKNLSKITEIEEEIRSKFPDFFTLGDYYRCLQKTFEKALWVKSDSAVDFSWDLAALRKEKSKIDLAMLETIEKTMLGTVPKDEDYINAIVLSHNAKNFKGVYTIKQSDIGDLAKKILSKLATEVKKKGVKTLPSYIATRKKLQKEFTLFFRDIHRQILPMHPESLKKYCAEKGISFDNYKVHDASLLLRNACLAPKCKHFLIPKEHLGHHMDVWEKNLPRAFHSTVRAYYKESAEVIYEHFAKGEKTKDPNFNFSPEDYETTKEGVLDYINNLKVVYTAILG